MNPGKNYFTGFTAGQCGNAMTRKELTNRLTATSRHDGGSTIDLSWLQSCAPHYNVSANPDDYIFAPVRAFAANIPNRNGHCFDRENIQQFDVNSGKMYFRTFEGKPLLINHKYVLPNAAGVIVSADLIQDGPYVCPELIVGADKTKNRQAYDTIASGKALFSMGAVAEKFQCSVCSAQFDLDQPCEHCTTNGLLRIYGPERRLSYMVAINPTFIEHSLLLGQAPADPRALHRSLAVVKQ